MIDGKSQNSCTDAKAKRARGLDSTGNDASLFYLGKLSDKARLSHPSVPDQDHFEQESIIVHPGRTNTAVERLTFRIRVITDFWKVTNEQKVELQQ